MFVRIGKNDVYVQAYLLPPGKSMDKSKALPEPQTSVSYPPSDQFYDFEFLLPANLPSSFIRTRCTILYSIYANIDVAFRLDPSVRVFFNVVQPTATATMMYPSVGNVSRELYPQCCLPPCCCCFFDLTCFSSVGKLSVRVSTDRAAYAPGEIITLAIMLDSEDPDVTTRITSAIPKLVQVVERHAQGHVDRWTEVCVTGASVNMRIREEVRVTLQMPPLPPTYAGGLGTDAAWFGEVSRYYSNPVLCCAVLCCSTVLR